MLSFLKSLLGAPAAAKTAGPAKRGPVVEHNGFTIQAAPFKEEGQYQTAGVISKEIDGVLREHRFVRADRFPSEDAAADFALTKARQIIDLQGDTIFKD